MRLPLAVLGLALCARAGDVPGRVVDRDGNGVAGVTVHVRVGWAHYALTPTYDHWHAVGDERTATTAADGAFSVADVPAGAALTAWARTADGAGVAWGTDRLDVRLGPFASVKGKVRAKRSALKAMRVWVRGGSGLGTGGGEVDRKSGAFEVGGLTPGPVRVHVKSGNFDVAVLDAMVGAGQTARLKPVKGGKPLPGPDPAVDCLAARLVDGAGTPVPGIQLVWSSRFMDGGMNSGEDGVVKLAGGGVAIGGPPYLLRLATLRGKERSFTGALDKVRRGVAIVELRPLHAITGTAKRGAVAVEHFRVVAVGPGARPHVYAGSVADGRFTILLPDGACRLVIGTVDGKLHTRALNVKGAADVPVDLK